jgi:chromosome segregation ATPase
MKSAHWIIFLLILLLTSFFWIYSLYKRPIKSLKEETIQLKADLEALKKEGKITAEKMGEEKEALQKKIRAMVTQIKKREADLKKLKKETQIHQGKLSALKKEVKLKEGKVKELTTREEMKSQVLSNVKKQVEELHKAMQDLRETGEVKEVIQLRKDLTKAQTLNQEKDSIIQDLKRQLGLAKKPGTSPPPEERVKQ